MKSFKVLVVGSLAVLVIAMIGIYAYYGGFHNIVPEIAKSGGETLVYEEVIGDYAQSGEVSDRVYQKLLDDYKITTTKGFGIYYDNPETTEKTKLRSDVGCILESDFEKIDRLKTAFEITEYPVDNYLKVEFPYKGTLSILLGIMKVYPVLNAYVSENGYEGDAPVMEIWDVPNKRIMYRKVLIKK